MKALRERGGFFKYQSWELPDYSHPNKGWTVIDQGSGQVGFHETSLAVAALAAFTPAGLLEGVQA